MIYDITQNNIGQYMEMSQGYIVNKTSKTNRPYTQYACAHDLAHHNRRTCRLDYSQQAPKFYAPTLQAARAEAQQRWPNLPFEECSNCQ